MLNDRFDPDWEVWVDNVPARVLRCNMVMRGVEVPSGEHTVVFLYRPQLLLSCLNATATLIVLVWGIVHLYVGWRRMPEARKVS